MSLNVNVAEDFLKLGCLSMSFTIFFLKFILVLCTLNPLIRLMNFPLSLNFQKAFPWWYALYTLFFLGFLVRMISSYSLMIVAASLDFSTLSSFSFKPSVSTFSLLVKDMINCFLISSLLSFLVLLALSEPHFLNYEQKITNRL